MSFTRGGGVDIGPVRGTLAINNSVDIAYGDGWSCDQGCGADILKLRNNIVKVGGKVGYDDSFDTGDPADAADEDNGVYQGSVYQFTLGVHSVKADPLYSSATRPPAEGGQPGHRPRREIRLLVRLGRQGSDRPDQVGLGRLPALTIPDSSLGFSRVEWNGLKFR